MNAFVQILRQLFEAVSAESWAEQAHFPFNLEENDRSRVHDLILFHQSANQAFGIAWIQFKRIEKLLIFPFSLERYLPDGALIALASWAIRDARADERFYQHMLSAFGRANPMITESGHMLKRIRHAGEPALVTVSVDEDAGQSLVRVDALEAYKMFRTVHPDVPVSREAETLAHLTDSPESVGAPRLISSFEYTSRENKTHSVGLSMAYVQSHGNLWNTMLICLQRARYKKPHESVRAEQSWQDCLRYVHSAARQMAHFHRSMMKAKPGLAISPETPSAESLRKWKHEIQSYHSFLMNQARPLRERFAPIWTPCFEQLNALSAHIAEAIESLEHVGLRIQTHGHLHLGQYLVGQKRLTLLDFQSDFGKIHDFEYQLQSCLDDYAALFISVQFAWNLTTHDPGRSVFEDVVDPHSEYGKYLFAREGRAESESFGAHQDKRSDTAEGSAPTGGPEDIPSLDALHFACSKAYFRGLKDDPLTSELFPPSPYEFNKLLRIYLFLRSAKELCLNAEPGNPKAHVILNMVSAQS